MEHQPAAPEAELAEFPYVPQHIVRQENWLARRRQAGHIQIAEDIELVIQPLAMSLARAQSEMWTRLRVLVGIDEATLYLPSAVVDAIVRVEEPELDIVMLDSTTQALVMEHALDRTLQGFEQVIGRSVRLIDMVYPASDPSNSNFAFEVTWPLLGTFPLLMTTGEALRRPIVRYVDQLPRDANPIENWPVTLAFRAGLTKVTLRELAELRAGDAIVLEETWLSRQKVVVVTGERFVQSITVSSGGLVLDGDLLRTPQGDLEQWTMEHIMTDTSPMSPSPEVGPVNDVQVKLVFELGRIDVSIGELEQLGEGYVFDLGKPQTQAVDILAGGRHIGVGELVRVADGLGVRVARIFR